MICTGRRNPARDGARCEAVEGVADAGAGADVDGAHGANLRRGIRVCGWPLFAGGGIIGGGQAGIICSPNWGIENCQKLVYVSDKRETHMSQLSESIIEHIRQQPEGTSVGARGIAAASWHARGRRSVAFPACQKRRASARWARHLCAAGQNALWHARPFRGKGCRSHFIRKGRKHRVAWRGRRQCPRLDGCKYRCARFI